MARGSCCIRSTGACRPPSPVLRTVQQVGRGSGSGSSVLVVDDDAKTRSLISAVLQRIGCVVYEAAGGDEALDIAETVRPQLVILDVNLPRVTGYEVCRELRDSFGDTISIMFVSGIRSEPLDRVAGLLIGADDYVVKPFDPDELVSRARVLLERRNGSRVVPSPEPAVAELTNREREVLRLLARGRSQAEIAGELFISPKTVATHLQRTLAKLGVHSRAQAVAVAHRAGLLRGDDFEAHSLAVSA
jgi:DNA-binding NarL/FixJ family response regulator